MQTLELFAGTQSFSKVARAMGHATHTVELDPALDPDEVADITAWDATAWEGKVEMLWASPPCQGFSVAVIGRNWNHDRTPKTDSARLAMALALRTIEVIEQVKPRYWFIENPRGMLRKMPFMESFLAATGGVRHTVTYCQYGDTRQKPTDIWTNCLRWRPKPCCCRGAGCHEAAPRGSRTGTQGIVGAKDRGRIPAALFEEIFSQLKQ